MSLRCDICGKGKLIGRSGRHKPGVAGKQWLRRAPRTRKIFKPNLQYKTIGGKRMRVCTKCLKRMRATKKNS